MPISMVQNKYRKFSNKRTGCYDKPLGDAFPPSGGFLRNENRTIISWDMGKTWKWTQRGSGKTGGAFIGGGAFIREFTVSSDPFQRLNLRPLRKI